MLLNNEATEDLTKNELNRDLPVVMAEGKHLVPFRTQQLSPPAPMVLLGQLGGRVGRCREY